MDKMVNVIIISINRKGFLMPTNIFQKNKKAARIGVIPVSPETMEIIREESIRFEHLVNDLRMLALSDAGELELNQRSLAPEVLINFAYDHYHFQATAKGIT